MAGLIAGVTGSSATTIGSAAAGVPEAVTGGFRSALGIPARSASGGASVVERTALPGSGWGSLSRHLIGHVYCCDSKGVRDPDEPFTVSSPITDEQLEISQTWSSPFEGMGPESKAPAIMAMIQSGSLVPVVAALQAVAPDIGGGVLDSTADSLKGAVRELQGRTGITKLNSRQVYSGMPPMRISFTQHFRALSDALREVEQPYQQMLEWIFPQQLAEDGILSEVIQTARDVDSFIKALFPSLAPKMVNFEFAGRTYGPLVVETVSNPLASKLGVDGNRTYLAVQVTLASLTALDRADIRRWFGK